MLRAMALAVILAVILLADIVPGGAAGHSAYAQTADSSIVFAENGTSPVGTFRASDQDGDSITWSLSGPDADLFSINDGVLSFREPPDYEDSQSAAMGNVYRVTIEASEGTHDVAVTVTDEDDAGMVNISRLQPQVSRPLSANLSDEDEGVTGVRWQWARSADGTTWTDIEGATIPMRSPAPADVGTYLRAKVTYSDRFGAGKSASAVSANRVEARTLSNAAPVFSGRDGDKATQVVRSVAENTAVGTRVGRAVSATDADGDVLFYELLDTPDLAGDGGVARFTIDSRTGQIRIGGALGADDGEREDEDSTNLPGEPALLAGEDAGNPNNSEYVLRVRVSDPSTAFATVNVIVKVTDVNEAPVFGEGAPTVLLVWENMDPPRITLLHGTPVDTGTYAVTDQDGADTARAYSVTGDDSDFFTFGSDGILSFTDGHEPDFEEKSSYSITVVARSGQGFRGRSATLDVAIRVADTQDAGEVVLSQREPRVGAPVRAAVNDPDGSATARSWVWERSEDITVDRDGTPSAVCRDDPGTPGNGVVGGWTLIAGAAAAVYTPQTADVGRCLRAVVVYRDDLHRATVSVSPGSAPATGGVEECVANDLQIGELTCTVTIGSKSGTELPLFMARTTGVSEAPVQPNNPSNAAPKFVGQNPNSAGDQPARTSRKVAENTEAGQGIGSPFSAHDDDGDLLIYALGGADAEFFGMSRTTGQLMTKAPLNYEARKSYGVTVTATDPSGAAASIHVTINVTDLHDPVHITGPRSVDYAENGMGPVAEYSAFDEEGHDIEWTLSGPDADLFTIDDGVLGFRDPPDYENPESAADSAQPANRNVYRVTIRAAGGTRSVNVGVTDVDESGTARIDRPQPQVGRPLEASLSDEDGGVREERWRWARGRNLRGAVRLRGMRACIFERRSPTRTGSVREKPPRRRAPTGWRP